MIKAIEDRNLSRLEKLIVRHLTFSKNSYLSQVKGLPLKRQGGVKD